MYNYNFIFNNDKGYNALFESKLNTSSVGFIAKRVLVNGQDKQMQFP